MIVLFLSSSSVLLVLIYVLNSIITVIIIAVTTRVCVLLTWVYVAFGASTRCKIEMVTVPGTSTASQATVGPCCRCRCDLLKRQSQDA